MNKTSYLYLLLFVLYFNCISAQESEELNNNAGESTTNFYTSQHKTQNAYDGLGYYKLYNNSLNYTIDRLSITLSAGFLEQNTIYNSNAPGFYGSFSTNVEYKISNRFSFYTDTLVSFNPNDRMVELVVVGVENSNQSIHRIKHGIKHRMM